MCPLSLLSLLSPALPLISLLRPFQCERDAMRVKVKHLKELMVFGGFLESKIGRVGMSKVEHEDVRGPEEEGVMSVQDCLEDLKRSMTEVVECWNIL